MQTYFDLHHQVLDEEIDAQEHVHNLRYLQWSLWAARDHSAAWGWNSAAYLARKFGWVVRDHQITYRVAALANDELIIRTWVSEINPIASYRQFMICRPSDRSVLAKGHTRWVFVDLNTRHAIKVPQEVLDCFEVCQTAPPAPWQDSQ